MTQSLWSLAQGQTLRLEAGPGARELLVARGRLWLTVSGAAGGGREDDVWLDAGQSLLLPSGAEVVLEAWPQAQFQLLVPPHSCPAPLKRLLGPLQALLSRRFSGRRAATCPPAGLASA